MAEITAAAVNDLRQRTGLPMMDCKKALTEAQGDIEKAIEVLRKAGLKIMGGRGDRETSFGRLFVYTSLNPGVGAMVELMCESAPVAGFEEFRALGDAAAKQLALGPGAKTPEELFAQQSPLHPGKTLGEVREDLMNRIREVMNIRRMERLDAACAGYAHHTGTDGVLLAVSGKPDADLAKDVCMHIAAMKPTVLRVEDLDPAVVKKEREILLEAARTEGKPENILEKMVEGRMKNFYATCVLLEQPFVKDDSQSVGKVVKAKGMETDKFIHWRLGQ